MKNNAIYIYGIIPNFYSAEIFRSLDNSGVYAIPWQNVSAIVSDREGLMLDYYDREALGQLLVQHQKTIEELMLKGFNMLIPLQLGTIVASKTEVVKILTNGYDLIIETLKKIEFLTEFDIAVTWADFPGIIKETANHHDIIELKTEIQNKTAAPTQIDQMKLGMMVQAILKEKNTKVELNILDALATISIDIKTHELMNDEMITNSAVLIDRNKMAIFEKRIEKIDEEYKGMLNFKLVGPLPCYSFFTLEVKQLNPVNVAQAMAELGLNEESSESEIKKAYLQKARIFHPDAQPDSMDEIMFNKINKAYHTLLDYSAVVRQTSKMNGISLTTESIKENLILVKIKD
jgi:hypothetical protein